MIDSMEWICGGWLDGLGGLGTEHWSKGDTLTAHCEAYLAKADSGSQPPLYDIILTSDALGDHMGVALY